jgi:hypothetical protein
MQKYSDFFQTLHDETGPTGHLGRGTHYSVLRAVVFHGPMGEPLPEGQFADFAVIWDEDHDTRVFEPIEEVYRRGLLSSFLMFGERKGFFTAVLPIRNILLQPERAAFLGAQINEICQSLDDPWVSEVTAIGKKRNPIISDDDDKVTLYLKNLEMLWQLGTVARVDCPLPFNPDFLKRANSLDLSVRTANCLANGNIVYIGDLVQMTEAEILRMPNTGRKSLNEIKEQLAQMELHLGMEVPGWSPKNIEYLAKCFELGELAQSAAEA